MPVVRPSAGPLLRHSNPRASIQCSKRPFSSTVSKKSGAEPHYDPPTGWLFGVQPGQKYKKEGWEPYMFWGFSGAMVLTGVAYVFKPDTSIQTWALEEARRRLEAEGILKDPESK